MGMIIWKKGTPAPFLDNEEILLEEEKFRAIASRSFPTYRIGFNLPPLWKIKLYATNLRCRVLVKMIGKIYQDFTMWYPGKNPEGDNEILTSVSLGKSWFGKYLQIISYDSGRSKWWLMSKKLNLRFYINNVEHWESVIRQAMKY